MESKEGEKEGKGTNDERGRRGGGNGRLAGQKAAVSRDVANRKKEILLDDGYEVLWTPYNRSSEQRRGRNK